MLEEIVRWGLSLHLGVEEEVDTVVRHQMVVADQEEDKLAQTMPAVLGPAVLADQQVMEAFLLVHTHSVVAPILMRAILVVVVEALAVLVEHQPRAQAALAVLADHR